MFEELEDEDDVINYDTVTALASEGLKNPKMIAHAMELPVIWFTETHKKKVDLAIERGLAYLAMEAAALIRKNAKQGDFAAQKYLLQNVDDTWTDKREVKTSSEVDIKGLPSLTDLFHSGLEDMSEDPKIIEGEYTEE